MSSTLRDSVVPEDSSFERRKARKRATDRRAQREHRLRRDAYIKQLESSLASLSEQSTADGRVKALLEANAKLKEEQARVAVKLRQLQSIVQGGLAELSSCCDANATPDSGNKHVAGPEGVLDGLVGTESNILDHFDEVIGHNVAPSIEHAVKDPTSASRQVSVTQQNEPSSLAGGAVNQCWDMSIFEPLGAMSECTNPGGTGHVRLPRFSPPIGTSDLMIQSFVDEARQEHLEARFDTSEPSLSGLLSDPPPTVLAFRLFHWIAKAHAMPLDLVLGTFWWLVLRTDAAYTRIPSFLRPTELELTVPHRIFTSLLVWPGFRRALIQDGIMGDPEAAGLSVIPFLNPKWLYSNVSGNTASLDVLESIQRQAEQESFWRVDAAFFAQYPQYSGCDFGSECVT
ncbi:hypothetical protein KC360_g6457 [Hortaea werneckii]|nr:hypothetical protein KC325_g6331 [Hortaea werneckii]KAI6989683.1 hypothetical protein KC359_g7071 [Hortaea werneckii]KAI7143342.1 hypothetical protein KC344_g6405 [Hortaea werneckii]KAI7170923.1 hypothetical protein KC360_g6457 [Hortaea werneckii]KAI7507674.1 hypothetical protein KC347_g6685 [Hortaea werneckii]